MTTKKITLKDCKQININVPIYRTFAWDMNAGLLNMKYEGATISNKDGKQLGSISPTLGAGIEIHFDGEHHETFVITAKDLWNAVCAYTEHSDMIISNTED